MFFEKRGKMRGKRKKAVWLSALVLIAVSCFNKKETPAPIVSPETVKKEITAPSPDKAKKDVFDSYGYVIRFEGALYSITQEKDKNPVSKWKVNLDYGEKLAVHVEPVKAPLPDEKADSTFFKAQRENGIEGYILEQQIAIGGQLAAVTEKEGAILFTSPKNIGAWTEILPYGTVFAYTPESAKDGFFEITAHNFDKKAYYPYSYKERYPSIYIKSGAISTKTDDIQSAVILRTAKNVKNAAQKSALLKSALNDYPDSVFAADINALLNPLPELFDIEEWAYSRGADIISDNGDNINVRDKPGVTGSNITGSLQDGYNCYFSAKTKSKDTVNGKSDYWYRKTGVDGIDGWVFGAYIRFE